MNTHVQPGRASPQGDWRVWTYRSLQRARCVYAGGEAVARALFVNLLLVMEANRLEGLELYDGPHLAGFLYRAALWAELREQGLSPQQGIGHLAPASPASEEEAELLDITTLVEAQISAILESER